MSRTALALVLLAALPAHADPAYTPTPQNLEARRWFQDAKFGLFVHWGVYSVLGDGEWVMNNRKLRVAEYERLPPQFNPTGFNAAEWVAVAQPVSVVKGKCQASVERAIGSGANVMVLVRALWW